MPGAARSPSRRATSRLDEASRSDREVRRAATCCWPSATRHRHGRRTCRRASSSRSSRPRSRARAPGSGSPPSTASSSRAAATSAVYSEPGHGTTFMIYLPRCSERGPVAAEPRGAELSGGRETILLVEDEERVRELAREVLRGHGYTSSRRATERCPARSSSTDGTTAPPAHGRGDAEDGRPGAGRAPDRAASGREGAVHVGLSGRRPGRARRARARRGASSRSRSRRRGLADKVRQVLDRTRSRRISEEPAPGVERRSSWADTLSP